jgi:hypothetical protein
MPIAGPKPSVILAEFQADVLKIAALHKTVDVKVFGSIARGQDEPGSDVDLLVTFTPDATSYDQVELARALEDLLGLNVDGVSEHGLTEHHGAIIRGARLL